MCFSSKIKLFTKNLIFQTVRITYVEGGKNTSGSQSDLTVRISYEKSELL